MHNSIILQGLNEAQCKAVMHGEGPAMIVAGPGSGKTTVIIRRLLYLIYELKVPAEKILVITYTKEAALSMQQKFNEQIEKINLKKYSYQGYISFGTFHSFFYQIIKSIKKYSEYQLITPQEKYKLAKLILKEADEEVTDYSVKRFLEWVSFFKNTGKHKDEEDLDNLFHKYQYNMQKYKRLDFDDMLYLCKLEFENNDEVLKTCQERYEYILIDEYQDINPIQYELMHMLTINMRKLFVVGDDDQAIYGFRGSDVECFRKFLDDYKDTKIIYLNINYRCSTDITQLSQSLISHNKKRLKKNIISGFDEPKGHIEVIGCENTRNMYQQLIHKFRETSIDALNDCAILFRTNASLQSFANLLAGEKIPFLVKEKIQSLYEHFISCDILDFFLAAYGRKDRALYLRIFHKLKLPFDRSLFMEEQVDLMIIKERIASGIYDDLFAVEEIDIFVRHLQRLAKMRPKLGIVYILHAMNYENYLLSKAGNKMMPEEWQEVLDWLKEDAESFVDFKSWMYHIQNRKEILEDHILKQHNRQGIHLMTMHGSKGLEYKKIYVLHLNDGIIPKIKKGDKVTEEQLEEERRLFYVAITRAKLSVELYYVTGTKENPRLKSRFLEELKNV